jgi:FMN phosphatase YigB (HAD superfamily)
MKPWDVITFDCYGTLIDWERGIRDAFHTALAVDGLDIEPGRILAVYHEV